MKTMCHPTVWQGWRGAGEHEKISGRRRGLKRVRRAINFGREKSKSETEFETTVFRVVGYNDSLGLGSSFAFFFFTIHRGICYPENCFPQSAIAKHPPPSPSASHWWYKKKRLQAPRFSTSFKFAGTTMSCSIEDNCWRGSAECYLTAVLI